VQTHNVPGRTCKTLYLHEYHCDWLVHGVPWSEYSMLELPTPVFHEWSPLTQLEAHISLLFPCIRLVHRLIVPPWSETKSRARIGNIDVLSDAAPPPPCLRTAGVGSTQNRRRYTSPSQRVIMHVILWDLYPASSMLPLPACLFWTLRSALATCVELVVSAFLESLQALSWSL
jgi:hypothetical protein